MAKSAVKLQAANDEDDKVISGSPDTRHPDLLPFLSDYTMMRDVREGATHIKIKGEAYLSKPSGFRAQSDDGYAMYEAYKTRAEFPEIASPTILAMVGVLHRREAMIQGLEEGQPLADMWESATPDALPLETLHRRISEELLTVGRVALLADMSDEGDDDLPWIALYKAESLINWSDDRDFFVLEEQYRVRTGYNWDTRLRYRVLQWSVDDGYTVRVVDPDGRGLITNGSKTDVAEGVSKSLITPQIRGGGSLEEIPLVIAGSRDLSVEPDEIPLLGVGRAALAIYRLDADYRHQLFMSGQETLFTIGLAAEDAPAFVGAGVVVSIPAGGDAKYVGPSGAGITAHRLAIEDERHTAAEAGARIFEGTSQKTPESGAALRIRARAATATLVSIALASAAALEQALRHCALMVGQEPETIVVVPNLDFVENAITPDEAAKLMELWLQKAISYETLYENLQRGDIASQERTAAEEQELVAEEEAQTIDEEGGALPAEAGAGAASAQATPDLSVGQGTDETGTVSETELQRLFAPATLNA